MCSKVILRPPLVLGLLLATVLLGLYFSGSISSWSPMGNSFAYDQYSLPRCGLAIRFGTNPFTSTADYPQYGHFAVHWVSQPMLCVLAGVPLSYLSPQLELLFTTVFYWSIHLWILVVFGTRLSSNSGAVTRFRVRDWFVRDYVMFACLGFFFPWYVLYVLGQYHALAVLAFALALSCESRLVSGFALSAIGKPVLAPAALVLLVAKKWQVFFKLLLICMACYLPWFFLRYDVGRGLFFGWNESFLTFFELSSMLTKFSVVGWNQEMGWSKVFDEFSSPANHYPLRMFLALIPVLYAVLLAWQKKFHLALGVSVLWFFFLYGRGHEYHVTLYLPLLAFMYCEESGRYRNGWTVVLAFLAASPTVFPLILKIYEFPNAKLASNDAMRNANPFLYWLFLLHKPILAPLLLARIFYVESASSFVVLMKKSFNSSLLLKISRRQSLSR
ncbi:MAG: hypothetical protein RIR26_1375 [Pseudomonadota bacterium]